MLHTIQYKCKQCEDQSTLKANVTKHIQSKHEDIKYLCKQCDHKATTPNNHKHHIESKHEGLKYSCHQFDLHATKAGNLNLEVQFKSKHEGIKYPCQECDPKYVTLVLNEHMNFNSLCFPSYFELWYFRHEPFFRKIQW